MTKYNRVEALKIAAEKVRRQAEEEKRKEDEYFDRITSGTPWFFFKAVVGFCTVVLLITMIEIVVDGNTQKLTSDEWKIDRELYMTGHQSIKVGDYLFVAPFKSWLGHMDDSFEITYSPFFKTAKKLSYNQEISENNIKRQEVIRRRSIFTWFPFFQILMLIPLLTYIFKRKNTLFNFSRIVSMFVVFPVTILILTLTMF